jgi:NitT/TauT family transport system substrate-binding protein
MQALLSGRAAAVPVHFDQAAEIAKHGNFKILLRPWTEYKRWINEIWVVQGSWLKKPQNERALVDLLKQTMTAFRKSDDDAAWYTDKYRLHATLPEAKTATLGSLQPFWKELTTEVKAFPRIMQMSPDDWHDLLPVYVKAGAIRGTIKLDQVIDDTYVKQAVSELGA